MSKRIEEKKTIKDNCPVNSHNEWDPLEEVIIGKLDGAAFPPYHITLESAVPKEVCELVKMYQRQSVPVQLYEAAEKERQQFISILKSEGVVVKEPDVIDFSVEYATPDWRSTGFCSASPRDSILIIGNKIIEAPMSWRSRYFETFAYRPVIQSYHGAQWIAAPKPRLTDDVYDFSYTVPKKNETIRYVINEKEPLFDAANFMRFGKDILALISNTANIAGIKWLRNFLSSEYTVHEMKSRYSQPMHLDDHLMPLAPGKLLINPEYLRRDDLPDIFNSWDILEAPQPDVSGGILIGNKILSKKWLKNINILVLNGHRIIVEESQVSTIRALKKWGFEPIPCPFLNYATYGGLFHCATVDVRRKGTLESYF